MVYTMQDELQSFLLNWTIKQQMINQWTKDIGLLVGGGKVPKSNEFQAIVSIQKFCKVVQITTPTALIRGSGKDMFKNI